MVDKAAVKSISIHLQKNRLKNKRDNSWIRLSSSGMCSRRIAYALTDHPESTPSSATLLTFEIGHALHEMVQSWLVELGFIKATRSFVERNGSINTVWEGNAEGVVSIPEVRATGHYDGLTEPLLKTVIDGEETYIVDYEKGERHVVEIKTMTDRPRVKVQQDSKTGIWRDLGPGETLTDFSNVYGVKVQSGTFSRLDHPKPEHIAQASMYASVLEAPRILFIYIAKDGDPDVKGGTLLSLPIKIFSIPVDNKVVDLLHDKFEDVWSHVDRFKESLDSSDLTSKSYLNLPLGERSKIASELPDRQFYSDKESQDLQCKWYCPFKSECYPDVFPQPDTIEILSGLDFSKYDLT